MIRDCSWFRITAGQKDYAERMKLMEQSRNEYYAELGIPPGAGSMIGGALDININTNNIKESNVIGLGFGKNAWDVVTDVGVGYTFGRLTTSMDKQLKSVMSNNKAAFKLGSTMVRTQIIGASLGVNKTVKKQYNH